MRVLVDTDGTIAVPMFEEGVQAVVVDSSHLELIVDDDDNEDEVRAEYLYNAMVDNGVHIALVSCTGVARELAAMDVVAAVMVDSN